MNRSTKLPKFAPCRVCGAKIKVTVETAEEILHDGQNRALRLTHPDGHPNCWNNNRWYGFRFKPNAQKRVIAEFAQHWNKHPDFDFFTGGDLSREWCRQHSRIDEAMPLSRCPCGGEPRAVEICRGHSEAVLLNEGLPDLFRIECSKCGYSTPEFENYASAVSDWIEHSAKPTHPLTH